MPIIVAATLACQGYADVELDGRETPISLFLLTVAESGDRKSSTDKVAIQPILQWQKLLLDLYRVEFKKHQRQIELWETRKKEWLKAITFESPSEIFPESAPASPLHPIIIVEEPTYEGVVKYLAVGQPSIGLFSDEGGRFFGGYAMSKDHLLKTIAGLSSLWDGKPISRMRGGDENMILYGRRFSLHLMVQEMVLERLIGNPLIEAQGFLSRCLISFPASTAGKRPYTEEVLQQDPPIIHAMGELFFVPMPMPVPVPELTR